MEETSGSAGVTSHSIHIDAKIQKKTGGLRIYTRHDIEFECIIGDWRWVRGEFLGDAHETPWERNWSTTLSKTSLHCDRAGARLPVRRFCWYARPVLYPQHTGREIIAIAASVL